MHSSEPTPLAHLTVVPAVACHLCEQADRIVAELGTTYPLSVERVALDSDEGRRLVALHRPAQAPLVLVDGRFFSAGRLPRRKLDTLLRGRAQRQDDDIWTHGVGAGRG